MGGRWGGPPGGWGGGGGSQGPRGPLIKGKGIKGREKGEGREEFNGDCWSKQDWKCDKAKNLKI